MSGAGSLMSGAVCFLGSTVLCNQVRERLGQSAASLPPAVLQLSLIPLSSSTHAPMNPPVRLRDGVGGLLTQAPPTPPKPCAPSTNPEQINISG